MGDTSNPFRFVGRLGYYDEGDVGLEYVRARWYEARTGRFVSRDPVAMERTLSRRIVTQGSSGAVVKNAPIIASRMPDVYRYAQGGPTQVVDPSGLEVCTIEAMKAVVKVHRYNKKTCEYIDTKEVRAFIRKDGCEDLCDVKCAPTVHVGAECAGTPPMWVCTIRGLLLPLPEGLEKWIPEMPVLVPLPVDSPYMIEAEAILDIWLKLCTGRRPTGRRPR